MVSKDLQLLVFSLSRLLIGWVRSQPVARTQKQTGKELPVYVHVSLVRKTQHLLVESSKLFLNETDNALYQDYLVQLRAPLNPTRLPKSSRLLWECFRYFSERLNEVPEFENEEQR